MVGTQRSLHPSGSNSPDDGLSGAERLVGTSGSLQLVRAAIRRVAVSPASVLVTGETGTGKELVARALHEESGRSSFLAFAVTELSEGILESELFGHTRGAFTGAVASRNGLLRDADGGTLFLDEIGDAPRTLQAKLLRVIETGEVRALGASQPHRVDFRLIAATHRDLRELVRGGRFRRDLFYRVHQTRIHVAPLRERPEDVEPIGRYLLASLAHEARLPIPRMTPEFVDCLRAQAWPGNVRELRSFLANALIGWDRASPLDRGHALESLLWNAPALDPDDQRVSQQMLDAYRRCRWNQEAARRELGLSRGEWRHRWGRFGFEALSRRRR